VDDWLDQFSATLAANDEGDVENKKRLFLGLLEGEALRWFNTLTPAVKDNWDQLQRAFEEEFQEIGKDAKVMAWLGSIRMKSIDTLRSYTQKVQQLVGKLSVNSPANLQLEWFMSGLPALLDFEVRKSDPQMLAAAIEIAKKYKKSALLSRKWAEKKQKKKVHFAISDSSTEEESNKKDKKSSRKSK
jgi:hypothetical protein